MQCLLRYTDASSCAPFSCNRNHHQRASKGAGSGQNSPQRTAHGNAPQPPPLGLAASRAAAAREGQGSPGRLSRSNSLEASQRKSPPGSPKLSTRSGGAGPPELGRASGLESHQPEGHPSSQPRRRRGFFACCGCGGADEDDDGRPAQAPPDARAAGSRTLPRLSEVSAHAERNSSFAARTANGGDDDDDEDFYDPRDEFSVYAPSDNED